MPPAPQRFDQIMLDPPWPQRKGGRRRVRPRQGRALDYATLSVPEIFALFDRTIAPLAAPVHNLWLWAIDRFLLEAEQHLRARGYRRHARLVWDKGNGVATAFTVRYVHEYLLWFYKPRLLPVAPAQRGRQSTVLRAAPREHSRKPQAAYDLVSALYPQARRLDVFSREARPGWSQWGDQCHYFQTLERGK